MTKRIDGKLVLSMGIFLFVTILISGLITNGAVNKSQHGTIDSIKNLEQITTSIVSKIEEASELKVKAELINLLDQSIVGLRNLQTTQKEEFSKTFRIGLFMAIFFGILMLLLLFWALNYLVVGHLKSTTQDINKVQQGDLSVDFDSGVIKNLSKNTEYTGEPFPEFMQEIMAADGLIGYIKKNR